MLKITRDEYGRVVAVESDGHIVKTGPIRGFVTLEDGTVYDINDEWIEVASPDHGAEVAHLIALRHVEDGHPHDVELDEETGRMVQRPFVYDDTHWKAHQAAQAGHGKKG